MIVVAGRDRPFAAAGIVLALVGCATAAKFEGPLKIGENGRHLAYADGRPFYYVADTPWQLLASLELAEAREYIDIRARQGFSALQLVATPWSFDDTAAGWDFEGEHGQSRVNAYGEVPFFDADGRPPERTKDVRFDRPNDAYWRHVDAVLHYLASKDMAAYFIPLWASNFSRHFSAEAHYAIGRTLGERYRRQANLVWALGGDEAHVSTRKYRYLLKGLQDVRVTQLVTMHPRSGRSSAAHLEAELDFHSVQAKGTVGDMVRLVEADYRRRPVKPTFLTETWYEHDKNGGVFGIHRIGTTPAFRAHYWAARLHGGFGEGYGAWTNWLNLSRWREDIQRPGARAIATHMRHILETVDWHNLTPDDDHLAVQGDARVHAARSEASRTAVAYFESPAAARLNLEWFGGNARLVWYDPATGETVAAQTVRDGAGIHAPGLKDAVLVVTGRTSLR